jgi:hypothetical protein
LSRMPSANSEAEKLGVNALQAAPSCRDGDAIANVEFAMCGVLMSFEFSEVIGVRLSLEGTCRQPQLCAEVCPPHSKQHVPTSVLSAEPHL